MRLLLLFFFLIALTFGHSVSMRLTYLQSGKDADATDANTAASTEAVQGDVVLCSTHGSGCYKSYIYDGACDYECNSAYCDFADYQDCAATD
mmetsp:Transcript_31950/g.55055  ORF Transcript_31950/g.55055 Transcript_31950/m.55055 type:complete len:92 (-) Transcript_31950:38-313(-)